MFHASGAGSVPAAAAPSPPICQSRALPPAWEPGVLMFLHVKVKEREDQPRERRKWPPHGEVGHRTSDHGEPGDTAAGAQAAAQKQTDWSGTCMI